MVKLNILHVTFEALPFIKVGGLADVIFSLAKIMSRKNKVVVLLPLHRNVSKEFEIKPVKTKIGGNSKIRVLIGNDIHEGELYEFNFSTNLKYLFIKNDMFFDRDPIYGDENGDYADNADRYIFFSKSSLEAVKAINFKPDIIHCHDMQTGLVPAYLKTIYSLDSFFSEATTVYTIHNIAYQGVYSSEYVWKAGLPWEEFNFEKLEFYGNMNFMKSGIVYADSISTVSPTYAKEISTDPDASAGLNDVIAHRGDICGILNGIDYEQWDPQTDKFIASNYSVKNLSGKQDCKLDLQKVANWKIEDTPIIGMVSRLTSLKGYDLLLEAMDELMKLNLRFVILGVGDKRYHEALKDYEQKYPKKLKVNIEFNDPLAHKIYAGSDFFLIPSKFEPCGLTQMISSRYGSIPIVHETGGLADSIVDFYQDQKNGNGMLFQEYSTVALLDAVESAISLYKDKNKMKQVIKNAMMTDFSWDKSAKQYLKLYRDTISKRIS